MIRPNNVSDHENIAIQNSRGTPTLFNVEKECDKQYVQQLVLV